MHRTKETEIEREKEREGEQLWQREQQRGKAGTLNLYYVLLVVAVYCSTEKIARNSHRISINTQ